VIEIRHFKYFLALVNEMNFTKAAKQLHIAQPALSQNIRQIEDELGAELFKRNNREITLTNAGKVFYGEAKRTLEQFERSKESVRQAVRAGTGVLSIGYTASSIFSDLPSRLQIFKTSYPEVELITRELSIDSLIAYLRHGQLDLICTDSTVVDPRLDSMCTSPMPMVVTLNRHHRLSGSREPVALSKFAHDVFVMATPYKDYTLYDLFLRTCMEAGFEPDVKYHADSVTGGVGLVVANLCVQLMHDLPLFQCPKEVVQRRISEPEITMSMHLVWRRGDLSGVGKRFIEQE